MRVQVTFSRVYEVPEEDIMLRLDYLEPEQITETRIQETATEIAYNWMTDEIPEFLANPKDFVSAKTQILH
jgi:hypothetical protein